MDHAPGSGPAATARYHLHVQVLFVCTANVCRSPMGAALFDAQATRRHGSTGVSSAGVDAGRPAMPDAVPPEVSEVMTTYGIDLRGHRPRALTEPDVHRSDLVIGMGRRHVQESVLLDPTCFARAFTLKELVRRGGQIGPRPADEEVGRWVGRANGDRTRHALGGRATADDIEDPYGGPLAGYRATAAELDDLTGQLAALLWPRPGP